MNFQLPIAKGVVSAFDEILKDIHNLLLVSRMHQTCEEFPSEYKEIFDMYNKITENSTRDECFKMIKLLKKFSIKEESIAKSDKETAIKDFYQNFQKFRDLVERKMTLPLQEWKEIKWDLMHFSKTYEKLQQELEDVRNSVEKTRMIKNKELFEQETKEKREKKMDLASEDFKSLQPLSIIANSEEHMDRISAIREKKLESFKDRLKIAEQDLKKTVMAHKKEIQTIIEESIETKSFVEWIEEKNYKTLKELEVQVKEEWSAFSSEMEISRNLGRTYAEKQAIYLDIKRQEDHEERLGKQDAAATLLQAHWRGYMTRRRLRGNTLF